LLFDQLEFHFEQFFRMHGAGELKKVWQDGTSKKGQNERKDGEFE